MHGLLKRVQIVAAGLVSAMLASAIYPSPTSAPSRELIWVEGATHHLLPGWIADRMVKTVPAQP